MQKLWELRLENDSQDLANKKLIEALYLLNKDLDVPTPLEYGIIKEDFISKLDVLSKQAIDSGSPSNNPIIPSHEQIKELYLKALGLKININFSYMLFNFNNFGFIIISQ